MLGTLVSNHKFKMFIVTNAERKTELILKYLPSFIVLKMLRVQQSLKLDMSASLASSNKLSVKSGNQTEVTKYLL